MRRNYLSVLLIVAAVGFCVLVPGCKAPSEREDRARSTAANTPWNRFVQEYLNGFFQQRPDLAAAAGRHEFDGLLPDWSNKGLAEYGQFLRAMLHSANHQKIRSPRERFEREYLISQIDTELFWLETAEGPFTNPYYYSVQVGVDPNVYLTREYAPLEARLRAFIKYLTNLPTALRQIRANLRTPMPKTFANLGRTTFGGLATFFETDVPKIFASVKNDELLHQFQAANVTAIQRLRELDQWFSEQSKTATENFALGPDRFRKMLWATERVDITLPELERIGREDLERNIASLKNACNQLAPGKSIRDCLAIVNTQKPKDGPIAAARRQVDDLRRFLSEKDLLTIPGNEKALVDESPPYMRWNFAYINIPGPYESGLPSTYYIAPPEPSWSAKEQLEYVPAEPDLLFTSVHEVWPGHFLQYLHANRSASKFAQVFVGYAFSEGWAHYTEEMMWQSGLGNNDPAVHIGQLLNALLRNARFLSAIGLHSGTMTVAESERLFQDSGFQDAATARQQAARGTFDPAYLNYTMGKLMIRKLRDDWCRSRGGTAAWKNFHDEFLSFGGPPIPLVREEMVGDYRRLF